MAYGIPVYSAIINAIAPITGGIICPPVDATASTAPANTALYPLRFIIGIVIWPVVATFAIALPEMLPNKLLEITAALAEPPHDF